MTPSDTRLSFGDFEAHLESGLLTRDGGPVKLEPQPLRVLMLLIRRRGELVTREEIQQEVWPDGTTVEFDEGLYYCIRQVRLVLGDSGKNPQFIQTVPKRGYRFLPTVTEVESPVVRAGRSRWRWVMGLVAVLAMLGAWGYSGLNRDKSGKDRGLERRVAEADHLAESWDPEVMSESISQYKELIRNAPSFAPAYAGLANVLVISPGNRAKNFGDAEAFARKALSLDSSSAMGHTALGHAYWLQYRWSEAEAQFRMSLEQNTRIATTHQLYGLYLAGMGDRQAEAIEHARKAVELDPRSGMMIYSLAKILFLTGKSDEAIIEARRTLQIARHYPLAYDILTRALIQGGSYAEAEKAIEEWTTYSTAGEPRLRQAQLLAGQGQLRAARLIVEEIGKSPSKISFALAMALEAVGERDAAIEVIRKLVADRRMGTVFMKTDPAFSGMLNDRRFRELLVQVGVP